MYRRLLWYGFAVSIIVLLCLGGSVVVAQSPEEEEGHGIPFRVQIVDPEAIPRGTCATLFWETPIEQDWPVFLDGEPVDPMGGIRVCPEETTVYNVLAETPDGPVEKTVVLAVVDMGGEMQPGEMPLRLETAPEAESELVQMEFVADPPIISFGSCSHLRWGVEPADVEVLLNGQPVDAGGEREVCPEASQTYELIVHLPDGMQAKHVTVQVQAGEPTPLVVPTTAAQPTKAAAQPTKAAAQPTTAVAQPTVAAAQPVVTGLSADLRPSDLYADNQPQGVMWGRITNDGHGTLAGQKVSVSGSGTATSRAGGGAQPLSFAAKEYTLNIAPGQTETINLGWPVDTSLYSYQFTMQLQAMDFTDPNGSNNTFSEAVAPAGAAAPGPGTTPQPQQTQPAPSPSQPSAAGALSVDVKPTDLYPDKKINGVMWARITNRGPGTLSNNKVGVFGYVTETPLSGGTPSGKKLPEREFTLNIAPGQEQKINLGWPLDLSKSHYDFSVTVKVKDFSDPNPGNNTHGERVQGMPQTAPIPPPGPSFTQTVTGLKADIVPVRLVAKDGIFYAPIINGGPDDLSDGKIQWRLQWTTRKVDDGAISYSSGDRHGSTTLQLSSGQTADVNTGVPYDQAKYGRYHLTCTVTPQNFTDPYPGNNIYWQTIEQK